MVSDGLNALLIQLRNHPLLAELLAAVEPPRMTVFKLSQAEDVEAASAKWIYQSGQRNQDDKWRVLLTGKQIPPDQAG